MAHEPDDALLTRYLMGVCSEAEKERIEERYFADDSTFERLCCLEDALIEQRLDGTLDPEERARFDRRLGDRRARERLLLTAALRRAARERPAGTAAPRRTFLPPAWFSAAAAVVVVMAGGSWVVWQNAQLRHALDRVRADRATLQRQHDVDGRRIAELEKPRADAARGATIPQPSAAATATPAPAAVVATFVLRPGLLRGPQGPPQLKIAASVTALRLRLELDNDFDYTDYRAELRTSAGDVRWSQEGLARPRDGFEIAMTLPAAAIRQGEQEIVLQGRAAGGGYEDAGHYYFDVPRR